MASTAVGYLFWPIPVSYQFVFTDGKRSQGRQTPLFRVVGHPLGAMVTVVHLLVAAIIIIIMVERKKQNTGETTTGHIERCRCGIGLVRLQASLAGKTPIPRPTPPPFFKGNLAMTGKYVRCEWCQRCNWKWHDCHPLNGRCAQPLQAPSPTCWQF